MKLIHIQLTCACEIKDIYINPKCIIDAYPHGERFKMTVSSSPEDAVYDITEQSYGALLERYNC